MSLTFLHALQMIQGIAPTLAGVLVASAWEGLVLVTGTALLLRVLPELSAERRTLVWTAVLVLLLMLPGLAVCAPQAQPSTTRGLHVIQGYSVCFALFWLIGSSARLVLLGRQLLHLAGVRRRAVPAPATPGVEAALRAVRGATLYVSSEVSRPCLAGLFRPRVLLPLGLLQQLTTSELQQVLLHEMEHLRRWDDWLNLLQQAGLVLLPLSPALLWVDRRLSRERELACDDGVLRRGVAAKNYAAVLLRLAELSMAWRGTALALSLLGPRGRSSELGSRVHRLLSGAPRTHARDARWTVPCAAVLSGCLAALLALCPQWVRFDRVPLGSGDVAKTSAAPLEGNAAQPRAAMVPVVAHIRPGMAVGTAHVVPAVARVIPPHELRRVQFSARVHRPARRGHGLYRTALALSRAPGTGRRVPPRAASRVVLTGFQVPQSVFAAVPVEGGWLIVQL